MLYPDPNHRVNLRHANSSYRLGKVFVLKIEGGLRILFLAMEKAVACTARGTDPDERSPVLPLWHVLPG